jgi:putative Holliday junction resolvase
VARYLGIDYGTKRVGLAISDGLGMTARPLEVVARTDVVSHVEDVVSTYGVTRLIIGLPTALGGHEGASAEGARSLGEELAEATGVEVEYVDEKFTSRMAEEALLDAGIKRRKRRETVDKVAAAIILQAYLDRRGREWNSESSNDVQDNEP